MSTCTCETRRIAVAGEGVADAVARLDPDCQTHGFPGDTWRAGSPLERFALTLAYEERREYGDGYVVVKLRRERRESPREVATRLIAETRGGMLGRVYYERGWPVVVLVRWHGRGPRNVLIRRGDGSKVVRSFRGLRREPPSAISDADRLYFSTGECASLAVMLHDRRGFPLAVTGNDYHAFVIVAPRMALDVVGVRPVREITRAMSPGYRAKRVARSYFARHDWSRVRDNARTRRVADALLAEYDREPPAA